MHMVLERLHRLSRCQNQPYPHLETNLLSKLPRPCCWIRREERRMCVCEREGGSICLRTRTNVHFPTKNRRLAAICFLGVCSPYCMRCCSRCNWWPSYWTTTKTLRLGGCANAGVLTLHHGQCLIPCYCFSLGQSGRKGTAEYSEGQRRVCRWWLRLHSEREKSGRWPGSRC